MKLPPTQPGAEDQFPQPHGSTSRVTHTQRHEEAARLMDCTHARTQTHSATALNTPNMLVNKSLVSSYLFTLYNISSKLKQLRPVALLWGEAGKRDLSIKILNEILTWSYDAFTVMPAANVGSCEPRIQYPRRGTGDHLGACGVSLKSGGQGYGTRRVVCYIVKYTQIHGGYAGYLFHSLAVFSWANYDNKERVLSSITFCNKPKTVASTLCLSARNTEVVKTEQAGFFSPFSFCISQITMSYPLGIARSSLQ